MQELRVVSMKTIIMGICKGKESMNGFALGSKGLVKGSQLGLADTACLFGMRLYLTPFGQARQFLDICGT